MNTLIQDTKDLKKLLRKSRYTVHVIQRHVSSSGMTRKLDLYVIVNNKLLRITGYVADILKWSLDKNGYLIVKGCGMDMHFHTVYSLSCKLYFKNGKYDEVGAYKLKHETI